MSLYIISASGPLGHSDDVRVEVAESARDLLVAEGWVAPQPAWSMDDVETLIELPGVYDGWSVALLKDGSYVNRWTLKEHPARWAHTEAYLANWAAQRG